MGNKIRVELSRGGGRTAKYPGEPGACFKCGEQGHWARCVMSSFTWLATRSNYFVVVSLKRMSEQYRTRVGFLVTSSTGMILIVFVPDMYLIIGVVVAAVTKKLLLLIALLILVIILRLLLLPEIIPHIVRTIIVIRQLETLDMATTILRHRVSIGGLRHLQENFAITLRDRHAPGIMMTSE